MPLPFILIPLPIHLLNTPPSTPQAHGERLKDQWPPNISQRRNHRFLEDNIYKHSLLGRHLAVNPTCCCLGSKSHPNLCNPLECSLPGSAVHGIFPGKNTGVSCRFLLKGIFPTQGSNWHPLHWQADSLALSHQGNLRQRRRHGIFWMCGVQKNTQSADSYYVPGIREVSQILPVCSQYK